MNMFIAAGFLFGLVIQSNWEVFTFMLIFIIVHEVMEFLRHALKEKQ